MTDGTVFMPLVMATLYPPFFSSLFINHLREKFVLVFTQNWPVSAVCELKERPVCLRDPAIGILRNPLEPLRNVPESPIIFANSRDFLGHLDIYALLPKQKLAGISRW